MHKITKAIFTHSTLVQCISGLSRTDQVSYEKNNGGFQTYGVEYRQSTGKDTDGYIYWTQVRGDSAYDYPSSCSYS